MSQPTSPSYSIGPDKAAPRLARPGEREAAQALPTACPYSLDQIVGHGWYPANRHTVVGDPDDAV